MIVVMSGMDYSDCYWREEGFKMEADNLFYPKGREFFSCCCGIFAHNSVIL